MKKLLPLAALAAIAMAIPAHATRPSDPGSQGKTHQNTTKSKRCKHSTLTKGIRLRGHADRQSDAASDPGADDAQRHPR